jgi:hypothetical protein
MSALPRQTRLTDPLINGGKMSDLNEMWARLEEYQPIADKRGYGNQWKQMCEKRTPEAAEKAEKAAEWCAACASDEAWAARAEAARAEAEAAEAEVAMEMAAYAINRINKAEEK